MRKKLSYLLVLVVGILYIVSTMGYGIHKCNKDGSQNLVLVYWDLSCETIHSHLDNEGNVYSHSHSHSQSDCGCSSDTHDHNDKCCNTVVYTVTTDQIFEDNFINFLPIQQDLLFAFSFLYDVSLDESLNKNAWHELDFRKLHLCKDHLHIINRTILV